MGETTMTSFVMHGARDAIAGGLSHIEEQVKGIELAVADNPGLAFDLSKTLVESVCKTVLAERRIPFGQGDDLPKLFKTVKGSLPLLPPGASGQTEIRKSIMQTLNGLHTAIQGLCELRNQCGFASHGSEGARPAMEKPQAILAAHTADAIVGFLYSVHRQYMQPSRSMNFEYDDYPEFNDYVDQLNGVVRIFEVEFRPSEILFKMEPRTYSIYLADFREQQDSKDPGDSPDDRVEASS